MQSRDNSETPTSSAPLPYGVEEGLKGLEQLIGREGAEKLRTILHSGLQQIQEGSVGGNADDTRMLNALKCGSSRDAVLAATYNDPFTDSIKQRLRSSCDAISEETEKIETAYSALKNALPTAQKSLTESKEGSCTAAKTRLKTDVGTFLGNIDKLPSGPLLEQYSGVCEVLKSYLAHSADRLDAKSKEDRATADATKGLLQAATAALSDARDTFKGQSERA